MNKKNKSKSSSSSSPSLSDDQTIDEQLYQRLQEEENTMPVEKEAGEEEGEKKKQKRKKKVTEEHIEPEAENDDDDVAHARKKKKAPIAPPVHVDSNASTVVLEAEEEKKEEEGKKEEEPKDSDPVLATIQKSMIPIMKRYGIDSFPTHDKNKKLLLKVEARKPEKSSTVYVTLGYESKQSLFSGVRKDEARGGILLCTPVSRVSEDRYETQWYPRGDIGSQYMKEMGKGGPAVIWTQTDEGMSAGTTNDSMVRFSYHLQDNIIHTFEDLIAEKADKVWPGKFAEINGANDARREEAVKAKQEKMNTEDEVTLTAAEQKAAGVLKKPDILRKVYQSYKINTRPFTKGGARYVKLKHNMAKPAEKGEEETVLKSGWKSVTNSEIVTNHFIAAAKACKVKNSKSETQKPEMYRVENPLPVYRLLSPEEHAKDGNKDSLIRMFPAEVNTIRPGDWACTLFTLKWTVGVGNDYWINPHPLAMVWIGHHDDLYGAVSSVVETQVKQTFSFAQRPSVSTPLTKSYSEMAKTEEQQQEQEEEKEEEKTEEEQ
jgi:hypothetical protein